MAETSAGLELPIGITEQRFMQQLARIEARSIRAANRAEQAFKTSNASSARSFQDLERASSRSLQGMQSLFRVGGGLLAGGAIAQQVRQYIRLADAATQMRNSLRVVGIEGDELTRVYDQLYRSAQRNSAPINSLVSLYSKLSLAQKELGVSGDDLIKFTDGIAVALRVAGTDSVAASGALMQLSQALGGGIVRAEEFNSILEGAPTIAQAVARGLKEAGGSVSQLRSLVIEGEVSSKAFFQAFQVGSEETRRQADSSQKTVGQSFTNIGNSLVTLIGEFDEATGMSSKFSDTLGRVAGGLDDIDVSSFVGKIQSIIDIIQQADAAFVSWAQNLDISALTDALGTSEGGLMINPNVADAEVKIAGLEKEVVDLQAQIENNTNLGFDNSEALARLGEVRAALAAVRAEAAAMPRHVQGMRPDGTILYNMSETGTGVTGYSPPPVPAASVKPVSLADYPAAPSSGGGGGGGGRRKSGGGGGRGGKSASERPFFEDVEKDLLNLEREIQLIGKSNEEVATAKARWELLDEAKKRGVPVNEALSKQIDAQAAQVGALTAELERGELAQQQFDDAVDGVADAFAGAIVAGESLREGLAQVFKQIAADIINSGIRNAISGQFDGGGGFLSGIMGIFGGGGGLTSSARPVPRPASFDGGGFTGYGARSGGIDGKGGFPAILHPNETVVDHTKGQGSAGGVHVTVGVTVDRDGNLQAYVKDVADQSASNMGAQINKALPSRVQQINAKPRRR